MLESKSEEIEFGENINIVIIQILEEKYLLEVENIKEIYVPGDAIVPVPLTDKSIVGIINIRGDIYSIISLRHNIYGNGIGYGMDEHSRILLLEYRDLKIAVLVDAVIGVRDIPLAVFKKQGTIVKTNIDFRLIKLTGVFQDESLILLDLDALIQPYIKSLGRKTEKKVELKPKVLERPKVQPKINVEPEVDSTLVIPQEVHVIKKKKKPQKKKMVENQVALSEEQQDTLKEIGNIGTGNAVTALSRLVKKKIDVTLTDVGIIPLEELPKQFGGPKDRVCGIFCHIEKPSPATILNIFEMSPLMSLISDFEMGNIMAGHYASALADLLGTKLMIDIPEFTMSSAGEIGQFLSKELESVAEFFIIIQTSIKVSDLKLKGMFFFIPDIETLKTIFEKLNIKHEISTKTETIKKLPETIETVGNIGAGNAANALAQMINKRVDINIPSVEMVELDNYANTISKKNEKLLVAWSNVVGKTRATVLTLFNMKDAVDITSIIVDDTSKKQIDLRKKINKASDFPELYQSAISELGHILGSHYVSAIGDLLGLRLMTEPPDMSVDTGQQLFNILKDEIGLLKKLSLVINTSVIVTDFKITGTFLFIPSLETLQELLDALLRFYS
jgi:chemotaxis protein CheC